MPFTKDDLKEQERQLAEIKDEMSRLNSLFNQRVKEAGTTEAELKSLDPDNQPPEVKRAMEEARAEAQREGERRRAQARPETSPSAGRAPSRRAGVIKL